MQQTPVTLLDKLRNGGHEKDWKRFLSIYGPFIRYLLAQHLPAQEVADCYQNVMLALVRALPHYKHQGPGSFRGWLRTVIVNKANLYFRRRRPVQSLPELMGADDPLGRQIETDHAKFIVQRLFYLMEVELGPSYSLVLRQVQLEGARPEQVARDLGKTVAAIYIIVSRGRKWLRENGEELLQ